MYVLAGAVALPGLSDRAKRGAPRIRPSSTFTFLITGDRSGASSEAHTPFLQISPHGRVRAHGWSSRTARNIEFERHRLRLISSRPPSFCRDAATAWWPTRRTPCSQAPQFGFLKTLSIPIVGPNRHGVTYRSHYVALLG